MRNRQNQLALLLIVAVTAFSVIVTWPGNPDKYLPDFIPWPSGHGINVGGFDRDEFRLGLDLAGGVSVTLEAAGETVPVRRGETLLDLAVRADTDAATLVKLNNELQDLRSEEYDRPLPETITELTLPLDADASLLTDSIDQARTIIEERVNGFGVSEAEVTIVGENRINVQIPGVSAAQAADLVGSTALLEFREIDPLFPNEPGPVDPLAAQATLDDAFDPIFADPFFPDAARITTRPVPPRDDGAIAVSGTRWIPARGIDRNGDEVGLTGAHLLADSIQRTIQGGLPALLFDLDDEGGRLMEQVTERLVIGSSPLGIFVDGELISAPRVNAVISGSGVITGLSDEQAANLRRQLRAGALPIAFEVIQQTEVAASLGEDSVVQTVQAGLIAFLAIVVFMVLYYRLPGVLASLALVVYVSVVMATFKLVPVTLTLAGVAGFILSMGLAVDGNILIFERLKEELRLGRSLQGAIDTGWARAWPAIRDANISTIITVVILWFFADQFQANLIKSFAIALLVGTLLSMASAIFVTRTFLNLTTGRGLGRRHALFGVRDLPAASTVGTVGTAGSAGPAEGSGG